eukprot:6189048-Pleurochrysis_carterae.AAC.1
MTPRAHTRHCVLRVRLRVLRAGLRAVLTGVALAARLEEGHPRARERVPICRGVGQRGEVLQCFHRAHFLSQRRSNHLRADAQGLECGGVGHADLRGRRALRRCARSAADVADAAAGAGTVGFVGRAPAPLCGDAVPGFGCPRGAAPPAASRAAAFAALATWSRRWASAKSLSM